MQLPSSVQSLLFAIFFSSLLPRLSVNGISRFFSPSKTKATPGNAPIKTKSRGPPRLWAALPSVKLLPLTDGLRLEEVGGAALAFTLAVDGRHLHLVSGLRHQARDEHLPDGTCENTRAEQWVTPALITFTAAVGENSRCSNHRGLN